MKFLPNSTLAYYEAMPQKKPMPIGVGRSISMLAKATKSYQETCSTVSPDVAALEFYALNHYYSLVVAQHSRNEVMPANRRKFCEAYAGVLAEQSVRMMHYLISIITREARHVRPMYESLRNQITEIAGSNMLAFLESNQGVQESAAVARYRESPPNTNSLDYVRAIEHVFNNGGFSSGYGGKPWGQIAKTLGDMLEGITSLEVMVDTAYTLAHNNGPIFNKGMMYQNYTGFFKNILDVQRGGQVPSLIKAKNKYPYIKSLKIDALDAWNDLAFSEFPGELADDVDWQKVMDLGALQNYSHLLKKSSKNSATKAPQNTKKPDATTLVFAGKPAKVLGNYDITSYEAAIIVERI